MRDRLAVKKAKVGRFRPCEGKMPLRQAQGRLSRQPARCRRYEIPFSAQLQRIKESDQLVSLLIGEELESPSGIEPLSVVT